MHRVSCWISFARFLVSSIAKCALKISPLPLTTLFINHWVFCSTCRHDRSVVCNSSRSLRVCRTPAVGRSKPWRRRMPVVSDITGRLSCHVGMRGIVEGFAAGWLSFRLDWKIWSPWRRPSSAWSGRERSQSWIGKNSTFGVNCSWSPGSSWFSSVI